MKTLISIALSWPSTFRILLLLLSLIGSARAQVARAGESVVEKWIVVEAKTTNGAFLISKWVSLTSFQNSRAFCYGVDDAGIVHGSGIAPGHTFYPHVTMNSEVFLEELISATVDGTFSGLQKVKTLEIDQIFKIREYDVNRNEVLVVGPTNSPLTESVSVKVVESNLAEVLLQSEPGRSGFGLWAGTVLIIDGQSGATKILNLKHLKSFDQAMLAERLTEYPITTPALLNLEFRD